jgi:hypothetical protein
MDREVEDEDVVGVAARRVVAAFLVPSRAGHYQFNVIIKRRAVEISEIRSGQSDPQHLWGHTVDMVDHEGANFCFLPTRVTIGPCEKQVLSVFICTLQMIWSTCGTQPLRSNAPPFDQERGLT